MDAPKYSIVQDWIKSEIYKGHFKNGDKILSENELMERFNFSRQTVRLAISNLEAQGLLKKVKGSGTYVNHLPVQQEKEVKTFGVILNDLDSFVHLEIIHGIEQVITGNKHNISLGITYNQLEKETSVLNAMLDANINGLIVEGSRTAVPNPNKDIYNKIKSSMPCVFINSCCTGLDIPTVSLDDVAAGYMAAKHLIDMGHRNIAAIFKSDDLQGHRRYEGYTKALSEANISISDRNIMWCNSEDTDDIFEFTLNQVFFKRFINCNAIICHNDNIAKKLINFLHKVGIKPFDDVSIISFDNTTIAEDYNLTSIDYDKLELGRQATNLCIKMLGQTMAEDILLPPRLIERDSVHRRAFTNSWGDYDNMTSDSLFE